MLWVGPVPVTSRSRNRRKRPGPHCRHAQTHLRQTHTADYDCALGEGISRDPIAEEGGLNLHGFVENDPIAHVDLLGQTTDIDFTYFGLSQLEGQPCCDKPVAYELDAKHVSIAYSATPLPQSFLATGQAFVTNPDLKMSGVSPGYSSWWSCCKDAPNPLPVDGPLPHQGLQFDCPCSDAPGQYVCIWRVRLHYVSCENFKWKLRVAEVGGSYAFLYTPKKQAWWQPKVGKGTQIYPP